MLPALPDHHSSMVNERLTAWTWPTGPSEKSQILRAAATGGDRELDRGEQSSGHIDFAVEGHRQRLADAKGVRDSCGDMHGSQRIDLAYRSGDSFRIAALMVRFGGDDRVERRRQRAHDLVDLLVKGNADHENPALRAVNRLKAGERLPDAVRRVADVDDGQRLLSDDLEAARPADVAQA